MRSRWGRAMETSKHIAAAERKLRQVAAEPETLGPSLTLAALLADMEAEASRNSENLGGNDDE